MPNPLIRTNKPYVREEGSPYASEPLAMLDCVVERVTYHNTENGYSVLKVYPADVKDKIKADVIPVIGSFQSPKEGECLRIYGVWSKHPQHGQQLKAERYETLRPATAAAMEKYLGSGMVKGIGPKMAERIVKKFGENAFDIIENHPDKLATVQGIGEKRVEMIQKTWQEQKEIRNVMTFLQSHGITPTYALKIYKKYKDRSIEIVEQNPYQLASDIWGIGFKSADKIAQNLGFALDCPARLEAGLVFVLNDQMDSGGHCFLPREVLMQKACEILLPQTAPEGDAVPDDALVLRANSIEDALDRLIERELLHAETVTLMGDEQTAVYTPAIFATEKAVAERVHTLLNSPWRSRLKPAEIDTLVSELPGADQLSEEQMLAVRRAVSEPVLVLTGGPGTGKCVTGDTLVLGADGLAPMLNHWTYAYGTTLKTPAERESIVKSVSVGVVDRNPPEPDTFVPHVMQVATRNGIAQTSHAYFGGVRDTIRLHTALGLEIEGTPNHRLWARSELGGSWMRLDAFAVGTQVVVRTGDNVWSELLAGSKLSRCVGKRVAMHYEDREPAMTQRFFHCRREDVVAFLSSFFAEAAQGQIDGVTLRGKSPIFLRHLQVLMLNLGIVSRYELSVDEATLVLDADEWNRLLATFTGEPNGARTEPTDIWDTVVAIEAGRAEVFDLSVPGEESFVANGFINHNTTTTKIIVAAFEKLEKRLQIASPTGRAAKRASEVTGREAKTIHRMLAYDPEKNDFKHGPGEPLELDVLVIDESSMLDLNLTHKTLRAVPDGAQVIFVGDVDQLPSVGPGNVLHDLITSGRVPVARLTQVFRQAAQSKIITNAHAINKGKIPELLPPSEAKNGADCVFIEISEPEEAIEKIKGVVALSLPRMGFKPDEITVLTPMQRGSLGGKNLNEILQGVLNPPSPMKPEHIRGPVTFRVGDRVMQRRNNYDKNVFNGDVGNILGIDPEEQTLSVKYPEQTVEYEFSDVDELMLAYALTTHKCVAAYEKVWTTRGLVSIKDLRVGECVATGRNNGAFGSVTAKWETGAKPVWRVTTKAGYQIDVSEEHPLLVQNPDAPSSAWRIAGELRAGDFLCLNRKPSDTEADVALPPAPQLPGRRALPPRVPLILTEDLCYLLGAIIGDGSYRDRKDATVEFTNADPIILVRVESILTSYGLRVYHYDGGHGPARRLYVVSRSFRRWLLEIGLEYVVADAKSIPAVLWAGSLACRAAFLRGLFDTDGSAGIGSNRQMRFVTASETLGREVQMMLLSLGIVSRRRQWTERAWCVAVGGTSLAAFARQVGFTVPHKQDRLVAVMAKQRAGKTNDDTLPHGNRLAAVMQATLRDSGVTLSHSPLGVKVGGFLRSVRGRTLRLSYRHLRDCAELLRLNACLPSGATCLTLADNYFHDPVVSVIQTGEMAVMYDITVEGEHSFVAGGGFVCHNSQGSEYPAAIILMANQHYMMLQRNLLYTALTRAKRMAVIIGSKYALKTAINNRLVTPRFTRLAERLQNLVESLSASSRRQAALPDGGGNGLNRRDLSHPPLPGRLL